MSTPKIDKQKKILIVGAAKSGNLGAVAMASSLLLFLKNQGYSANNIGLSTTRFIFDINSNNPFFRDIKVFPSEGIVRKLIPYAVLKKFFGIRKKSDSFDAYTWADVIIDIHGINFVSKEPRISSIIIPGSMIIISKLLNKKYIKFTQSIGPIEGPLDKLLAKFFLSFADLIIPRENESQQQLELLNLNNFVDFRIDSAYCLNSKYSNFTFPESSRLKIGVCLSSTSAAKSKDYFSSAKKLIAALLDDHDIFLFSHYSKPNSFEEKAALVESNNDDNELIKKMFDSFKNSEYLSLIKAFDSPEEAKSIIKQFDILIASRYHACVAGLSSLVPTIAFFSWSYKYESILASSGLNSNFSLTDKNIPNHYDIVRDIIKNKEHHKNVLKINNNQACESSKSAFELLRKYI